MKLRIILFLMISFLFASKVRIKELAFIDGARPNQLMGYGLVVGLKHTGDSAKVAFTAKSMFNLLKKMGIAPDEDDVKHRNVASVMVTTEIPPFGKPGQKIDVHISSVGDASSIRGGVLLFTPLMGADGKIYATSQGNIIISGISVEADGVRYQRNEVNRGFIPNGGIIEEEIPVKIINENNLTLLLHKPDFVNAARMVAAIEDSGLAFCDSYDASRLDVRLNNEARIDMVEFISKLLNVEVDPDTTAKIVISERNGTIVIGERVRISPVAINYGDISIKIEKTDFDVVNIQVSESKSKFEILDQGNTLSDLVKSLNKLGTKPSTLISILQAIKSAGAITAEIVVI